MARGPKRIFLTGTLDPKRTPYGRGGGWHVRFRRRPLLLRQHVGRYVPYDLVRDANDPDVAAEADFLRAADGRREANLDAVQRLREALARLRRIRRLNKRDLPEVASVEDLAARPVLGLRRSFVATGNVGVAEVLAVLTL